MAHGNQEKAGFVYFLLRDNGWFKIGRTNNPERRFRQLRHAAKLNGYKLAPVMMIKVENQYSTERMFHKEFRYCRIGKESRGREWFKLSDEEFHELGVWAEVVGESVTYFYGDWYAFTTND